MNLQLQDKPAQPEDVKLIALRGLSWERFKAIEANLEEIQEVRLSYLAGVLEIMSPIGDKHETVKSTIGVLLEAYMRDRGIRHYRRGGFTLEASGYASGTPDESYSIGKRRAVPDIVIEVIITSGSINRIELYKPLRVPEVWFWQADRLQVFHLREEEYEEVPQSEFLQGLDLALLTQYVRHPDQYNAAQEFLALIQGANT